MVLLSVVERGISMVVIRRSISIARKSISTIGSSGRGLSIDERSISTIGSSGKSISISEAGRSLPGHGYDDHTLHRWYPGPWCCCL